MDFMELMRDTTRFLRDAQYLTEGIHRLQVLQYTSTRQRLYSGIFLYFVILKILKSRRALSTLIPKDMPGLKKPQTTSKMLPTMT